jgi:hypothetical protein
MSNIEPYRIETTRERLTDAIEFAKAGLMPKPQGGGHMSEDEARAILDDIKILEIGLESHKQEMDAIYYTMRLRGIEEADFPMHVDTLTADDIYIAVELSTASEDEVIAYTLGEEQEEAPAV